MVTRIKICGLTRAEDVELAVMLGVHAVGFVLEPTSPRCISHGAAEELARIAKPYCTAVGVYGKVDGKPPKLPAIQAVEFSRATVSTRIQTVRIGRDTTIEDLVKAASRADAILIDAFSTKGYGGTGKRVDWGFAAEAVQACPKPVILAGGLNPENVGRAIEVVRPYGIDVSSGIEFMPGVKDHHMLRDFVAAAL